MSAEVEKCLVWEKLPYSWCQKSQEWKRKKKEFSLMKFSTTRHQDVFETGRMVDQ